MEKIKIQYDVSILSNALKCDSTRSGIFFVAYNILKELNKRKDVELSFYFNDLRNKKLIISFLREKKIIEGNNNLLEKFLIFNKKIKNKISSKKKKTKRKIIKLFISFTRISFSLVDNFLNLMFFIVGKNERPGRVPDIFLSPMFAMPEKIKNDKRIKKFIIIYDLIPYILEGYDHLLKDGSWFMKLMDSVKNKRENEYFFAISKYTKNDLLKYSGNVLNEEDIFVIPLAASNKFYKISDVNRIKNILKKHHIPEGAKYMLTVSNLDPRKNIEHTIKCFIKYITDYKINDLYFVIVGCKAGNEKLDKISIPNELKDKIIFLGYVDDEDLTPLYNGAEFFVYMSLYEGFGLPVLEAMQCGIPVITLNTTSLPEVVGNAGIMVNPTDEKKLISAFKKLHNNSKLQQELSEKGLKRAREFSWEKTVDIMVDKFNEILL